MFRTCQEASFGHTSWKKVSRTSYLWQKSASERLRFTSNAAEFTGATWTTGYRRNESSGKGTARTLCSRTKLKEAQNASKTKRQALFIGTRRSIVIGNSGDVGRARRALQLYAENRFLE